MNSRKDPSDRKTEYIHGKIFVSVIARFIGSVFANLEILISTTRLVNYLHTIVSSLTSVVRTRASMFYFSPMIVSANDVVFVHISTSFSTLSVVNIFDLEWCINSD